MHAKPLQSCLTLAMPWTKTCQAPLSMRSSRKEYWSVAMPSSRGSSRPRDGTCASYAFYIGRWVLYPLSHLGSPIIYIHIANSLCCTAETNKHYKAIIFQFLKRQHRVEEQWLSGDGGRRRGRCGSKGAKLSIRRMNVFWDLMYSLMTEMSNTVSCM